MTEPEAPEQARDLIPREPGLLSLRTSAVFASANTVVSGRVCGDRNGFACVEENDWK